MPSTSERYAFVKAPVRAFHGSSPAARRSAYAFAVSSCRFTKSQSRGAWPKSDQRISASSTSISVEGRLTSRTRASAVAAFCRAGTSAARAAARSRGYSGVTKTTLLRVARAAPSSPEKRAASRYWPSATSGTVHSSVPETPAGAAESAASPRSASFAPRRSCRERATRSRTGAARVAPGGQAERERDALAGVERPPPREKRLRLVRRGDGLVVAERVDRARRHLDALGERLRVEGRLLLRGRGGEGQEGGQRRRHQGGDVPHRCTSAGIISRRLVPGPGLAPQ